MRYKLIDIIKEVQSIYKIDKDNLLFTRGGSLRTKFLFINKNKIDYEGVASFFIIGNDYYFSSWKEDGLFKCNKTTLKIEKVSERKIYSEIGKNIIVKKESNFEYYNEYLELKCSSDYYFSFIQDNIGVILFDENFVPKDEVVVCRLPDTKLWQFPLSSLGGTQYEPDETDKVDEILGIIHGNLWIYTNLGRLIALNIETGEVVKKISGNPSDKSPEYEKTFALGDCYFRESDNNIVSINSSYFQVIDTKKCSIIEQYNTVEADPEAMETYKLIFSPLLQGDYFTFLGEKKGDYRGIGWVGLYDYKARKLVWEYEVIPQEERNDTRNRLVSPSPMRMSGNKLYVKDIQDNLYIFEREE